MLYHHWHDRHGEFVYGYKNLFSTWKHLHWITNPCFHARFWRIFIIIQLKRSTSMSFKRSIEKDVKHWIRVCLPYALLLFLLNSQKMKIRGLLSGHRGSSWTLFKYTFRCFAGLLSSSSSSVCGVGWCRNGDRLFRVHTEIESEGSPQRGETSLLSYCLSFYSLHLSSHPHLRYDQFSQSPFIADGGKGSGLLECWHVPIGATVLHYSISGSELLQGLGVGVFKAGYSWISFSPSSFPLVFFYLFVWPGHRRYRGRWSLT